MPDVPTAARGRPRLADRCRPRPSGRRSAGIERTAGRRQNDPSRKIIKDAQLTLEVAERRHRAEPDQRGRRAGRRLRAGDAHRPGRAGQKQAVLKIAVPVDQFEATLQRIREAGSRVLSEQASGIDATQEYVDTQSQIANLEATQARIRQFLDQAKTVEEALQVNAQLTEIEGQIGQLKGRLQFLSQRAAYSTIAVQLQQPPPPTPTPSPTPSPSPTPTPEPIWNPGKTAAQATSTLATIVQALATVAIWLVIVVLPLALPVVLLALIVRWWHRRAMPHQRGPAGPATSTDVDSRNP